MKRPVGITLFLLLVPVAIARPAVAQDTAATAEATAESHFGYDKGFFVESPDGLFSIKIGARVQPRWELTSVDNGDGVDRETLSAFQIARARLTFSGTALSPAVTYKFQTDFGKGFVTLKDFYVDYEIAGGPARLRVGQWKRPFMRNQITSSGNLEHVDRAITDRFFGGSRDIGVIVHNDYEKSPRFEWLAGVFNGGTGDRPIFEGDAIVDPMTGEGTVEGGAFSNIPDRFGPMLIVRFGYNHNGIKGYSEADLEGGPLRAAVAVGAVMDIISTDADASLVRANTDFSVKASGFAVTGGVYVQTTQDGDSITSQGNTAVGFDASVGYVLPQKVQPVVRYAFIAPDGDDDEQQELIVGLGYYPFGHNLKWQTDLSLLGTGDPMGDTSDYRIRSQLQLAF